MRKIFITLCLFLAISSAFATNFVPDPNKVYNIIENGGGKTIGALGTQPTLTNLINLKSQAFHFVSTGAPDSYYLKNMDNKYLNKKWGSNWESVYADTLSGTNSQWVIVGADSTGVRLMNSNNSNYLGSDGTGDGSSLYTDKSVTHWTGLYKLKVATVYTDTPTTLYNETFFASWSQWSNWKGFPSTVTGQWSGGVNLETTANDTLRLEQWWGDHGHILHIKSTDPAVIIPNINVADYDILQVSFDIHDESARPIIDVQVGSGAWVSVTTVSNSWSWQWKNFVLDLKDATGINLSQVSTISLRFSHAGSDLYYDNVKVLGRVHNYEFTGGTSTDPTISTNWVGGLIAPASSTLVISGGNLVLNQSATYNSITVNPTAKLTLNDTKSLTASSLLLKSDATGTATFVDQNVTPATISATVQQYIPATDRNWYISSPIASATNANLSTGAGVVEYNEALGTWPSVSGTLNPMKGYVSTAGSAGTGTLSFSGNMNSGSKSVTLSRTGATKVGFNLVGNPYPSYLSWTQALATSANCLTTIWYRTKSAGVYAFQTYNASGDIGVPLTTTGYIPPMQAFWVRTSVDGSTLTVNNTMRSHGDGSSNLLKARAANNVVNPLVRLQVSNGVNSDETVIYFNANADNGFDSFDSPKMFANNVNIPEIFTTSGTEQLVINGLKTLAENVEIPLGFATGTSNDFTLAATELKNLENGMRVILKDNLLQSETDLSESAAYNFSSDVTTAITGRFSLIFKVAGAVTSVSKPNSLNAQVFVNTNKQIVIVASEGCNYSIYNSVGQKINEGFTTSNRTIVSGQKTGMYVVRLLEGGKIQSSKVIIK